MGAMDVVLQAVNQNENEILVVTVISKFLCRIMYLCWDVPNIEVAVGGGLKGLPDDPVGSPIASCSRMH